MQLMPINKINRMLFYFEFQKVQLCNYHFGWLAQLDMKFFSDLCVFKLSLDFFGIFLTTGGCAGCKRIKLL